MRILVLEDNPDDFLLVQKRFREVSKAEFELEHVSYLKEAKEHLKKGGFDLVLSDLHLPDSQGTEAVLELIKEVPEVPVVALTGTYLEEQTALEAVRKGAQDYLIKEGLDGKTLVRTIRHAIERHKLLSLRDNFVNMVSHELRTPLSSLREAVAQFWEGMLGPVNERQKHFLNLMLDTVDRLNRTTSELLDLAKMEAGKSAFHPEDFDIVALAEEIKVQFEAHTRKKSLALDLNVLANSSVTVWADRDKIARVFINFLSNASKFTETGTVEVMVRDLGDQVECSVSDTGIGIAQADLAKVFSKFEQFGTKGRGENQGSGLGLSLCQEIINLHRGTIWVESEPGKGSRFVFRLPKKIN